MNIVYEHASVILEENQSYFITSRAWRTLVSLYDFLVEC